MKTSQLLTSIISISLKSSKQSSLHHLRSTVYILCTVYKFYLSSLWFCHQQLFELPVQGILKVTVRRLYSDHRETQLYLHLANSRKWQNVQQFLELSSTMFNVYWVINEVVFPLNVSIILIKQLYNTWYWNWLPVISRVPNSALWVPPLQKCVLKTRYVEARNINTDCSCRHLKQTNYFFLILSFNDAIIFWDYLVLVTEK